MLSIIGIAIALAMDAFAVSCGVGMLLRKPSSRQLFRLSWHFGLFQFLLPLAGWALGATFSYYVVHLGKFAAFAILVALGLKMLWHALSNTTATFEKDPTKGRTLVLLSLAVSIDAFAIGLSLTLLGVHILWPAVIIGIVAGVFTLAGMYLGCLLAGRLDRHAYALGGIILVAIGINSLF